MTPSIGESAPRILLTGWRFWPRTKVPQLEQFLEQAWVHLGSNPRCVLMHGACHRGGVDIWGEQYWKRRMRPYRGYPARREGGRTFGPERNQYMVDIGADLCVAAPQAMNGRGGTWDCIRRAQDAKIETWIRPLEEM